MTVNDVMAHILRYFIEFDSFRAHCVKVVEDVAIKSSRSPDEFLVCLVGLKTLTQSISS